MAITRAQAAPKKSELDTRTEPFALEQRRRGPLSTVAWQPQERMAFSDWVEHGRKLGLMGRSGGWWVGDWLNYGNSVYGERYVRASRITDYDVQTLMNMAYVASRFEPSRRRESLSWSHHAEVTALDPEDQDRLLLRAEVERLSVRDLRDEVRRERRARKQLGEQAVSEQALEAGRSDAAVETDGATEADGAGHVCPECGHSFAV